MEIQELQIAAGAVSSFLFASSTIPMLVKAYQTKDLRSYSLAYLTIGNVGNVVHWVYVSSLPFGPIWFLHSFFTVVTALMLFWYWRYEKNNALETLGKRLRELWDTVERQGRQVSGAGQGIRKPCLCAVPCVCPLAGPRV